MIKVNYYDKYIGWIIYPILAVSFIFFANDNDFETLIQLPSFKWDMVFSLVVASVTGGYLAWLTRFLDKSKSWEKNFTKRATAQSLYGIATPLTFVFTNNEKQPN